MSYLHTTVVIITDICSSCWRQLLPLVVILFPPVIVFADITHVVSIINLRLLADNC
jgi:hypothetical protein